MLEMLPLGALLGGLDERIGDRRDAWVCDGMWLERFENRDGMVSKRRIGERYSRRACLARPTELALPFYLGIPNVLYSTWETR